MMDMVVTRRVNAGMEEAFEAIARQVTANTLSQDEGCLRSSADDAGGTLSPGTCEDAPQSETAHAADPS